MGSRVFSASGEFFKFCVIGVSTALLQVGLFETMYRLGIYYEVSSGTALLITLIAVFLGNRIWTFKSKGKWTIEFIRFISARIATVFLNEAMLYGLVHYMLLGKLVAQVLVISALMVVNYVISKRFVFKRTKKGFM
ncbi:MAG: GtrA family protein [Firmicutes bacterium]|nr:GtrA family protein [Bacillota bacterium]